MYPAVACQLQKDMSAFNIYSQTSADSHLFIPFVLISRLYFLPSYCKQKKYFVLKWQRDLWNQNRIQLLFNQESGLLMAYWIRLLLFPDCIHPKYPFLYCMSCGKTWTASDDTRSNWKEKHKLTEDLLPFLQLQCNSVSLSAYAVIHREKQKEKQKPHTEKPNPTTQKYGRWGKL